MGSWQNGLFLFLRTTSQILAAGVAITAFALLLHALTFNLRDRVARSFALILACVVIIFTAESIGGASSQPESMSFWLRFQWVGIVFLPTTYLQFADALLETTGKPSMGRRRWSIRLAYMISAGFLLLLPSVYLVGPLSWQDVAAPYLQPTLLTYVFLLFYVTVMGMTWYVFIQALNRTTTPTSRRRMAYLLVGALAPALGSFPYMLFAANFAGQHMITFWLLSVLSNFLVGGLVVVMAYSVSFFGVPWPDRVVKSRLLKWLMRGPVTASVTLGMVTVTRRTGEVFGVEYSALVPIVMVVSILLMEYMITMQARFWERWLFYGSDKSDLDVLRLVEERLLTRNDLKQFLEMVLAAVRDRLQASGAYVAALNGSGLEMVVETGGSSLALDDQEDTGRLLQMVSADETPPIFRWGEDLLVPLMDASVEEAGQLLGLLGISGVTLANLDEDQLRSLDLLAGRAALALRDRRVQQNIFQSLEALTPEVEMIQRLRAAGRYASPQMMLEQQAAMEDGDLVQMVKDALTHYWGGPKLTQSPLMKLRVVQEALAEHDGNQANALRAVLRDAIQHVRPEGERRFTGEWILYNILEMKFLEGKKVREIALRLAMSEADLYRKQRIAVEAVAKSILEMEADAGGMVEELRAPVNGNGGGGGK